MPRFLRQFGLRTLLLFCTLAAVCFGLWRSHMTWVDRQHAIAQQIGEKNGSVRWGTWGPSWLHDAFGSRYFSYIITVDWQHKLIINQDLELLRELTSLEELDVAGNRISNKGLEVLGDLPHLRRLAVWRTLISDQGLKTIGKLKQLEVLDIQRTDITEQGLRYLGGLPKLKVLRHSLEVTDEGIEHLAAMPSLRLTTLSCRTLSEENLRWVAQQPKLQTVTIVAPQGNRWAEAFVGHPTLQSLTIAFADIQDAQMRKILEANTLTEIDLLNVSVSDAGLIALPPGGKLQRFQLMNTKTTPGGFLKVIGPTAVRVHIEPGWITLFDKNNNAKIEWYGRLTDDLWPNLAHCTSAKQFYCQAKLPAEDVLTSLGSQKELTNVFIHCPINDRVMEALAGLSKLEILRLHGQQNISPAGYGLLAKAKCLKTLSLLKSETNDQHLAEIGKLQSLTSLVLSGCPIRDQGIQHLVSLSNLEGLRLVNCPLLTDDAFREIAKLPKLQFLTGKGQCFSDAGLQHLHGMPTLRDVQFKGYISSPGLQALRDSLPMAGKASY
ncbi:hypothetical protein [Bremerella cremea]|nr:hypothetical protein [Bremerella cremea]